MWGRPRRDDGSPHAREEHAPLFLTPCGVVIDGIQPLRIFWELVHIACAASFALPNGCNNYYCIDDGYGGMHCWQALDGGGSGNLAGCTTVRLFTGG